MINSVAILASAIHVEDDELSVGRLAIQESTPGGCVDIPGGIDRYLLVIFHTRVKVRLHGVERFYPANSLIIWEPHQSLYFGSENESWEYSWVEFHGRLFQRLLWESGIPRNQVLPVEIATVLVKFLLVLHRDGHATDASHAIAALKTACRHWLPEIGRRLRYYLTGSEIPHEIAVVKHLIDTRYAEPITLQMLAGHSYMSITHLSREFNKYYLTSPIDYLTSVRMFHAGALLKNKRLRIAQLCERVGYHSQEHFSAYFRQYYGASPRTLRQRMHVADKQEMVPSTFSITRNYFSLPERWEPVIAYDFSRETVLDPRFATYWHENLAAPLPAREPAIIQYGMLRLLPHEHWFSLRWNEEVSEEVKIDLTLANTSPEGVNIALAISGDTDSGYRLRIYCYHHLEFEAVVNGKWEVLYKVQAQLNPHAAQYHVVLWRSDNIFYVELDGRRVMEYVDPMPPRGMGNRTFAIARYGQLGSADITRLYVATRRAPLQMDVLEPGRVLLHAGNMDAAYAWLQQAVDVVQPTALRQEALYLLACCTPASELALKDKLLLEVGADRGNPFACRALRELVLFRAKQGQIDGAITAALLLAQRAPDDDTPRQLADKLREPLRQADDSAHMDLLTLISRLPVTQLHLHDAHLTTLLPLRHMRLRELHCQDNQLTDLSPLRGMPLESLRCYSNDIVDIAPLKETKIQTLICDDNHIVDLTPLREAELLSLSCDNNAITDLTPLAGKPLTGLHCSGNDITEITALRGMPLVGFWCESNAIADLSPLVGAPLTSLRCSGNQIADLSPLEGMPLYELYCSANQITDLSPLSDLPIRWLHCEQNQIVDLTPLHGLPLERLLCVDNPITDLSPLAGMPITTLATNVVPLVGENSDTIATLPLEHWIYPSFEPEVLALLRRIPALRFLNDHAIDHVHRLAEVLCAVMAQWRAHDKAPDRPRVTLRPFAESLGESAYLAVPLAMPYAEAEAFCRWQGGIPACPASPEKFARLHAYLVRVGMLDRYHAYHLGLRRECESAEPYWLSGEPYSWEPWMHRSEGKRFQRYGHAGFSLSTRREERMWKANTENVAHYVVIEW